VRKQSFKDHLFLRIYVSICVCTCVCVCMHIYMCTYICKYMCLYVYMYVCMYVSMFVCMYVRMYVCMYQCRNIHECISAARYSREDTQCGKNAQQHTYWCVLAIYIHIYIHTYIHHTHWCVASKALLLLKVYARKFPRQLSILGHLRVNL